MINLLLGSSGSGKSYEATVYHVLEALKKGRKVITNLPLNVEAFNSIDGTFAELIELRKRSKPKMGNWIPGTEDKAFELFPESEFKPYPITKRVFSHVWDFYDEWRHPVNGTGALFVIDEAQNCIPNRNCDIEVIEYTALHRHWFADVFFITQSYGKLDKDIRENVQMVYRFRKKTAWGQPKNYIRKVQDGVRGEVLNTTERTYKPQFFPLYRSHTQADGVGQESNADDIVPIWRHWSFMGAGAMLVILVIMFASGKVHNPLKPPKPNTEPIKTIPNEVLASIKAQVNENRPTSNFKSTEDSKNNNVVAEIPKVDKDGDEPLTTHQLHIAGHIHSATKDEWLFAVSQNGQSVFTMNLRQLKEAGYSFKPLGDCLAEIQYLQKKRFIACDVPTIGVTIGGVTRS